MSLKVFSIFSSGGHFVQRSETILAILEIVDGRMDGRTEDGRTDGRRTTDKYRSQ